MKTRAIASIAMLASGVGLVFACGGSSSQATGSDAGTNIIGSSTSSSGANTSSSGNASSSSSGNASSSGSTGFDGGTVIGPLVGSSRSCAQPNGGNTCGPNGTDDCCKTLPVSMPGNNFNLDKYNITAGRMRVFIESVGGNVRGWIQANRPSWFEPAWDKYVPMEMDSGESNTTDNHVWDPGKGYDGVYQQLGPIHYGTEGPGNEGCLTKEVGNARTYRLDDATNTKLFADTQEYDQAITDKKPQQCTTFFMFAAFCAWDGGRLPTLDELQYAWDGGDDSRTFPWGPSPAPGGWSDAYPTLAIAQQDGKVKPPGTDQTRANYQYNFFEPAQIICLNNNAQACDYTVYVAPPGRFPAGDGPFGHSDLAGNVYNVAMPMTGNPGDDPVTAQRTVSLAKTGAFDIHAIPTTHPVPPFKTWSPFNKYLAVGGRCARSM